MTMSTQKNNDFQFLDVEEWILLKRILISGKTSLLRFIIRFPTRMLDRRHIDVLLVGIPIVRGSVQYTIIFPIGLS